MTLSDAQAFSLWLIDAIIDALMQPPLFWIVSLILFAFIVRIFKSLLFR